MQVMGLYMSFYLCQKCIFLAPALMLSHKNEHITAENEGGLPHCVKKYLGMHV